MSVQISRCSNCNVHCACSTPLHLFIETLNPGTTVNENFICPNCSWYVSCAESRTVCLTHYGESRTVCLSPAPNKINIVHRWTHHSVASATLWWVQQCTMVIWRGTAVFFWTDFYYIFTTFIVSDWLKAKNNGLSLVLTWVTVFNPSFFPIWKLDMVVLPTGCFWP